MAHGAFLRQQSMRDTHDTMCQVDLGGGFAGVLVVDYFVCNRRRMLAEELFKGEDSAYWFYKGWNDGNSLQIRKRDRSPHPTPYSLLSEMGGAAGRVRGQAGWADPGLRQTTTRPWCRGRPNWWGRYPEPPGTPPAPDEWVVRGDEGSGQPVVRWLVEL